MRDFWLRMSEHRQRASYALALSMGIAFGLMPKLNLTAVLLIAGITICSEAIAFRFSRLLLVTTVASWIAASLLSPYVHRCGTFLIGFEGYQNICLMMDSVPVLPWLRLNNTNVAGALLVGTLLIPAVGCFLTAVAWLNSLAKPIELRNARLFNNENEEADEALVNIPVTRSSNGLIRWNPTPEFELTSFKAASVPSEVETMASAKLLTPLPEISASHQDYSDIEVHESVIEIVRFRNSRSLPDSYEQTAIDADCSSSISSPPLQVPMNQNSSSQSLIRIPHNLTQAGASRESGESETTTSTSNPTSSPRTSDQLSPVVDAGRSVEAGLDKLEEVISIHTGTPEKKPRDEALRYLLWHLSGPHDDPVPRERAV